MRTPRDAGWGNPYDLTGADMLAVQVFPGRWLRVRNADLGVIFTELVRRLRKAGWPGPSPERPLDDWGYAGRLKRWAERAGQRWGQAPMSSVSDHAWGTGVDLDTIANPMLSQRPGNPWAHTNMPRSTAEIARGLMLDWGGTWTAPWDPQHFGFTGTPSDARRLAQQIRSGSEQEDELSAVDVDAIKDHIDKALAAQYRLLARGETAPKQVSRPHALVSLSAIRSQVDVVAGRVDALSALRVAISELDDDEAEIRADLVAIEDRLAARIAETHPSGDPGGND